MVRYDDGRKGWYSEFEQAGERVFKRFPKGITRAQAETWETRKRREIFDRAGLGKKPDVTLEEAIAQWLHENKRKNQRQALSEAKQWEPFVGGRLLRDAPEVAGGALRTWTKLRAVNGSTGTRKTSSTTLPKASTVNRRLMLLKAVCKHAYKKGLHPENLSARIETLREPPGREIYLTRANVAALMAGAPSQQSRAAIGLLAWTGLRASELLATTAASSRGATILVEQSKSGKPRNVPVPSPARMYLRELPLQLSYWTLRKEFLVARKAAKLPPTVTLHTLRHTCASWLINAGVDLYTVGKILGHSSTQTTTRYAHLATDTLEKAMRRLK